MVWFLKLDLAYREDDKDEDDLLTLEEFGDSIYHSLTHWPKYNPDFEQGTHTAETTGTLPLHSGLSSWSSY